MVYIIFVGIYFLDVLLLFCLYTNPNIKIWASFQYKYIVLHV